MITIEPQPEVLAALKSAFPTPPNSASRALDKYWRALEELTFASLSQSPKLSFKINFNAASSSRGPMTFQKTSKPPPRSA